MTIIKVLKNSTDGKYKVQTTLYTPDRQDPVFTRQEMLAIQSKLDELGWVKFHIEDVVDDEDLENDEELEEDNEVEQ